MYLTSLLEVSVCDAVRPDAKPSVIRISMEPTFVALGPAHAALGMNNHVFYHSIASPACPLIAEQARAPLPHPAPHASPHRSTLSPRPARRPAQEYLGTVDRVELNREIAAVLSEGRLHLHPIEQQGQQSRMFPPDGEPRDITCVALTAEFLVYATARGTLTYYYLQDGAIVSEYDGTRLGQGARSFPALTTRSSPTGTATRHPSERSSPTSSARASCSSTTPRARISSTR